MKWLCGRFHLLRTLLVISFLFMLYLIFSIVLVQRASRNAVYDTLVQQNKDMGDKHYSPQENAKAVNRKAELSVGESDGLERIDWHNYTLIEMEAKQTGLGEQGKAAHLGKDLAELEKQRYSENGFNGALSDYIALNRSLKDIRHPKCKQKKYLKKLPNVSVVVPFHNEHMSTLLRTVYSVLNRSPEHLIKEIFIVDDASTKPFLKQPLETIIKHLPKVHIVRLSNRSGLISARLAGARRATGDVLVFLDSHTEATVNWLPPLLEPIALDSKTAVCPYIDVIAYDTFEYRAQDEGARGAFDWEFFYKRLPLLPQDIKNMPEPFPSPVMAGGLFAISREFFWSLGGYDPGLDIWGGEQYELSFKIWQCGGRMLDAPCSRVGHIYRKFAPFPNPNHGDFVAKNYRRVAEVWMDEYAQYLYKRRPRYLQVDPGDLTEQKNIRKRLKCKPFKWFMHQVAFDLTNKYPLVEPEPFAKGKIRPVESPEYCIDTIGGGQLDKIKLNKCNTTQTQDFVFTWHQDIMLENTNICWDLPESAPGSSIVLFNCHKDKGNQLWRYMPVTKMIQQGQQNRCVDFNKSSHRVFIAECDKHNPSQKWLIDYVNLKQLAKWDTAFQPVTGPIEYHDRDIL